MRHNAPDGCRLVGREPELESLTGLFGSGTPAAPALVFTGGPGIGKTVLWEAEPVPSQRRMNVASPNGPDVAG